MLKWFTDLAQLGPTVRWAKAPTSGMTLRASWTHRKYRRRSSSCACGNLAGQFSASDLIPYRNDGKSAAAIAGKV